jgi:hypothetical protein
MSPWLEQVEWQNPIVGDISQLVAFSAESRYALLL